MAGDLLKLGSQAIQKAENLGAQQAEIFMIKSRGSTIEVENSQVKSAFHKEELACVIRSVIGKKLGTAYVSTIAQKKMSSKRYHTHSN
jgi:predicted Zn-dependent protease